MRHAPLSLFSVTASMTRVGNKACSRRKRMSQDWLDLAGRRCVVTGAGQGIGRGIAKALGAVGARLILLDRDIDSITELARELGDVEVHAISCDVSSPRSVADALSATRQHFGGCDVLVNNAAIIRPGALADLRIEDWQDLLNVNLTGYFNCSQAFGGLMREGDGGSIVNLASISAFEPQPFSGAYSVSKAGIVMLSRNLAVEWGSHGIRSNVVCPAMIRTKMTEVIYADPAVVARRCEMVPLGRIGSVEDVADAVLFLASARSCYISGQELLIDGGLHHSLLAAIPRPGFEKS
jgi:NAD(P)-dependent dehydrogenase (short-subunit alcohol dehydrogenase family)